MQHTSDAQLLREYAANGSETAFAEIVVRHTDLVYSAALRQSRSPELARDIAQCVLTDLARKAIQLVAQLQPEASVSGWLYRATLFATRNAMRQERRRTARAELTMQDFSSFPEPDNEWPRIAAVLDDAMAKLSNADREAVVLRYFQDQDFRSVGRALGVTDDTAQKRVSRAVERLRRLLAARGVITTTSGLLVAITANAVHAAPMGFAASLSTAAIQAGTTIVPHSSWNGALKWIGFTKAKMAITAAAGVILVFGVAALHDSNVSFPSGAKHRLPAGTGAPSIYVGGGHGIILASDGSLWSWGENYPGWPVLGLGNVQTQKVLRRIGEDRDWISVACSPTHSMAIKADGTLWGWGQNLYGQLGLGSGGRRNSMRSTPTPTAAGNDWKGLAAGGSHSLGVKTDGTLWAWGNNWAGQLGIGSTNREVLQVTQVGMSTNWIRVWAAGVQSVAQEADGTLWFWGSLTGSATDTNQFRTPTLVSADKDWMDVSFGYFVVFALKRDGSLWAWGRHAGIYTGAPLELLNAVPRRVGTNSDWQACSSSEYFSQVLQKRDGSLWLLDASDYGAANKTNRRPIEFRPIKLTQGVVAFAGGYGQSFVGAAITRAGEVWTWGRVLGEYTPSHTNLQALAKSVGWKTDRFESRPVMRDRPWLLPIQE